MDIETQRRALRVGQGMQHRSIKTVLTVQVLIALVTRLEAALLIPDQYFSCRRVF
ncbi:hypothetical protein D3C85_1822430 [compost metagenome]